MKLESPGILISLRPFGERDAIAHIFTRDHGIVVGMLRGANTTKMNKPIVGQIGNATWTARLDSALGIFHWEPEKNLIAPIIINFERIKFVNCIFDLINALLPERESYSALYDTTIQLITNLQHTNAPCDDYLQWEITLLRDMGFALDLTKCSGCGATNDLCYLSPKTGRAVCCKCAAPYKSRLFQLPIALDTTLRFLEKTCTELGTHVPVSRQTLSTKKFS